MKMTSKRARLLLDIFNGSATDAEAIKRAFHSKVMEMHPDRGGQGGDMALLQDARDLLLNSLHSEISCRQCHGRGYIKARLGVTECGKCEGEGVLPRG